MKFIRLRDAASDNSSEGSGPDNTAPGLMDSWGNGEGVMPQGAPPAQQQQQAPQPRQVTPPRRPAQQVIQDNTDANQIVPQQTQQTQNQQQPTSNGNAPAAPAVPMLSEADLTRIATVAAGAARGAIPQQQQQRAPEPAMTDEQFNARYRVPIVTAQTMQAINDPDPAKGAAALNALLKQTYTSSLLMSNDLHQAEIARVRNEMTPHVQAFQTFQQNQQKVELENQFYSLHPDLVAEKELVNETIDAFQAKRARGELPPLTRDQAFKAVADNVRKLVARMGGALPADAGQPSPAQHVPTAPVQRRPAAATQQGRGSSGQFAQPTGMDKVMASWDA